MLPNAQQSENVVILSRFESEDEEAEQSLAEKHESFSEMLRGLKPVVPHGTFLSDLLVFCQAF